MLIRICVKSMDMGDIAGSLRRPKAWEGEPMTKAEQARLVNWRSKILQHAKAATGSVAQTCRHFGLSRKSFYKWKKRLEEHGDAGLADRPRRPLHCPWATPPEAVSKILYLRQNYHFGPGKISDYLERFHQVSVAASSVY